MSDLFLTPDELIDLTGFKSAHGQLRWLEGHRWRFATTRSRKPRVARVYFDERMGASSSTQAKTAKTTGRTGQFNRANSMEISMEQPDFTALDRF